MSVDQFYGILLMSAALLSAIGWIGWGLTYERLHKERNRADRLSTFSNTLLHKCEEKTKENVILRARLSEYELNEDKKENEK